MARGPAKQASNAANTASTTGAGYGTAASGIAANLIPTLNAEATGNVGMTPQQQNAELVAGEQGAGGANAGIAGEAGLRATRTRNTGALSGVLDEASRNKTRQLSENALNVQNKNADVAQQNRQRALGQLQGLYGTNVEAQLRAMGLIPEDVNAETNAGKSGWLQNVLGTISTIASLGGSKGLAGIPGMPG